MKYLQQFPIAHVAATLGELDETTRKLNTTAVGDGVVFVDVDTLEDSEEPIAKLILEALPKNFGGIVYLTR